MSETTEAHRVPQPTTPLDAAREGWTKLPPNQAIGLGNSYVSGDPFGDRLRVAYFVRDVDQALVGRAWFGALAEGPPRHAHGGSMAALLDEVMGSSAWLVGHPVVAAKIGVEFKRPLALGTTMTFAGWVERVEGRRVSTRAELLFPDGSVCAQSEGLFIVVDITKLGMR